MNVYPFSTPIILTESMYAEYGGVSGSATSAQLQNSFRIAEQRVSRYIGTLLLPHNVTGTFPYNGNMFVATDYGYVHSINSVNILSLDNLQNCTVKSDSACAYIWNDTFGYLDVSCVNSICGCNQWTIPYQFQIGYTAGLPTGTANQPTIEHALVIVAELALGEMLYPRMNETSGDRAITDWSSEGYSESRKKWARTALGDSARTAYAAELIRHSIDLARRTIRLR